MRPANRYYYFDFYFYCILFAISIIRMINTTIAAIATLPCMIIASKVMITILAVINILSITIIPAACPKSDILGLAWLCAMLCKH